MHAQLKFSELVTKSIGPNWQQQQQQPSKICQNSNFNADKKFSIAVSYATIYLCIHTPKHMPFMFVFIFWLWCYFWWSCAKFNPEMVFIAIVILVDCKTQKMSEN